MRRKDMRRGSVFIDSMTSFMLIFLIFILSVKASLAITTEGMKEAKDNALFLSRMAKSYRVLREVCPQRDNEIDLTKLVGMEDINLYTENFGSPTHHTYCIRRGVYITQTGEVGILEVC